MIQVITGFIGTLGFCVIFNIRGRRMAAASIGGLLSWGLFLLLNSVIHSDTVNYFIVSVLISFYSQIVAKRLKTPTTPFLTTSLIPLIPGGSLYYTMAYAYGNDMEKFIEKGIYTLKLSSALALGIIVVTAITRIIKSRKNVLYKKTNI